MKRYSLGVFIPLKIESQYFYYDTNANRIIKVPETFKKALVEYVYTGYVSEYFMVDVTLVTKENVLEYLENEKE